MPTMMCSIGDINVRELVLQYIGQCMMVYY